MKSVSHLISIKNRIFAQNVPQVSISHDEKYLPMHLVFLLLNNISYFQQGSILALFAESIQRRFKNVPSLIVENIIISSAYRKITLIEWSKMKQMRDSFVHYISA